MENIAEKLYKSFNTLKDVKKLILKGETENQYLECKSPQQVIINRGLKQQIGKEISAFSNTGGGVILFGVSTTRHGHSATEFLSQIEEIGLIKEFKKELDLVTATSIDPSIVTCRSKIILEKKGDTRGVIVLHIPFTPGDPVRNIHDHEFYIRVGDSCSVMPYETIKRMFAGTAGPELSAIFSNKLVKLQKDSSWKIPIILSNASSSAARDTKISVTVLNKEVCNEIRGEVIKDMSDVNPGTKVFMGDVEGPIFRGMTIIAGNIIVKMKKEKLAKRNLRLKINIFSSNMRAKTYTIKVKLAKKGFSVISSKFEYLY